MHVTQGHILCNFTQQMNIIISKSKAQCTTISAIT